MKTVKGPNPSNKSGLHPCGQAVLIEPYEPELKKSAIYIPPTAAERSQMVETRGIVVEIGISAWEDEEQDRAVVGQKVIFSKFTGMILQGPKDGKTYRMLNGRDIFCTLEE